MPAASERFARWHRGQPIDPTAAKQGKENGLELIVRMMCGEQCLARLQHGFESAIANLACRCLNSLRGFIGDAYVSDKEFDTEIKRDACAICFPDRCVHMQLMIDMHGTHALP